jgi:hypothetical protein
MPQSAKGQGTHLDRQEMKKLLIEASEEGIDPDFESLVGAASQLDAQNFAAFLVLFLEEGRNLRATNRAGQTAIDVLRTQSQKGDYLHVLAQALSKAS